MYGTAATRFRWFKMTQLKKCRPSNCECVEKLSLLYVTKPISKYFEMKLDKNIEIYENAYIKCYNKKVK
jgi:hypothetical protein